MTQEQTTRRLVIDRGTWRWGEDSVDAQKFGDTQLLNRKGFKCCLDDDDRNVRDRTIERLNLLIEESEREPGCTHFAYMGG